MHLDPKTQEKIFREFDRLVAIPMLRREKRSLVVFLVVVLVGLNGRFVDK
jgi:hypothetical protein